MKLLAKKNKQHFNKAIILLSIALATVLCVVTAVVYFVATSGNKQNINYDYVIETDPNMPTESANASVFKAYKAVESETNREVPLSTVFGTSYTKYGCELVLNPDSTFTLTLGATNNEDSYGTYTQQEDKLLINYANGKTDEFAVTKDEQNNAEIQIQMGLYKNYLK